MWMTLCMSARVNVTWSLKMETDPIMTTILWLKGMTNRVGKRWLLIAEPARKVMSMPRASVHELGNCPKRWFMII